MKYIFKLLLTLFLAFSTMTQTAYATEDKIHYYNYDLDPVEEYEKSLTDLKKFPRFKVTYDFKNLRSDDSMTTVELYADQETGDVAGNITFLERATNPRTFNFSFVAYDNFSLVYVNLFDYLNSMDYFEQEIFSPNIYEALAPYKDCYVLVDSTRIINEPKEWTLSDAFMLVPDLERLQNLDRSYSFVTEDRIRLKADRLGIPENTFGNLTGFSLGADLTGDISFENGNIRVDYKNHFVFTPNTNKTKISLHTDLKYDEEILYAPYLFKATDHSKFRNILEFNTSSVTDRLVTMSATIDKTNPKYKLSLRGVNERYNFSLFDEKASNIPGIQTFDFGIFYTYAPANFEIPEFDSINRLSQQEFNYLLQEALNLRRE